MPITFKCTCGTSITVPDKMAGKQGKCKKCGKLITAPAAAAGAKPAAAKKKAAPAKAGATPSTKAAVVASSDATLSEANVSETNVDSEGDAKPAGMRTGVVKFKCPSCKIELKVPLTAAGSRGKCRKCGASFVSPVPDALKQARAKLAAAADKTSLRDAFSVVKVRCACGMTSAVLKGRAAEGTETCPACGKKLTVAAG